MVFLVSDFLAEGYETALAVCARRHDVVPVVVTDPVEDDLPGGALSGLWPMADSESGATVWIDNACIPTKATNPDDAHAFINYLLEPEIGARVVNAANYASANKAAREKVKPEILNNPSVYHYSLSASSGST